MARRRQREDLAGTFGHMARWRPSISQTGALLGITLLVTVIPVSADGAKVKVPAAPTITNISSIRRTATTFDIKVSFTLPRSTGGAPILSTVVSAGGKSCTTWRTSRTCTLRGLRKGVRVGVAAKSRNSRGFGKSSSTVRYVVGSKAWKRPSPPPPPTTTTTTAPQVRPYDVVVPSSYSASSPAPLVILLHGYGANGSLVSGTLGFDALAQQRGFLLVRPDGTVDLQGNQFWNATDACCDFANTAIDDEAYLMAIVDKVSADFAVDQKRIYFVGHSNGGFMSYRMACNRANRIAAVAVLAGAMVDDAPKCTPANAVSILHVHGTNDGTISYGGGDILGNAYPGAEASAARWVQSNQCTGAPVTSPSALDLVSDLTGDDTSVTTWSSCSNNAEVVLWKILDGVHTPMVNTEFASRIVDFFLAHPKP